VFAVVHVCCVLRLNQATVNIVVVDISTHQLFLKIIVKGIPTAIHMDTPTKTRKRKRRVIVLVAPARELDLSLEY
jgi:hypothetical protein